MFSIPVLVLVELTLLVFLLEAKDAARFLDDIKVRLDGSPCSLSRGTRSFRRWFHDLLCGDRMLALRWSKGRRFSLHHLLLVRFSVGRESENRLRLLSFVHGQGLNASGSLLGVDLLDLERALVAVGQGFLWGSLVKLFEFERLELFDEVLGSHEATSNFYRDLVALFDPDVNFALSELIDALWLSQEHDLHSLFLVLSVDEGCQGLIDWIVAFWDVSVEKSLNVVVELLDVILQWIYFIL